ncbi:N-acetylglucosamine-6-phosphate deacetylase [Arcticibacterium luteifluviistationis]|uniref:N-acetylglucosamine-6-phosphate deacetylase n=1 Tax=Arcticibacterium luteifluviistationis TaxID=1784714 RepID=A0A2Z4G6X2_9BACT|nr:N-acetylglucosamine-6-phosphate deacetylase [Arcticibacterium luteifluviistationis]AWV96823.1 N-acetylglucosamine-6-phosphate deacetylase [Arcticibacterium luteifluviistationis]
MSSRIKIVNGKVITPEAILEQASVLVSDGKIIGIEQGNREFPEAMEIDAKGQYISPGFIDIHVHGGGGSDFMDGTPEAFLTVAETHARFGTTAMFPTTLTAEPEDLEATLNSFEKAKEQNKKGASLLGIHLEGPYFAMSQRGAQDPRFIRNPDEKEYKELIANYKSIKRWSAAPELPGAMEFGKYLTENNILAAIAHTDAIYEEAEEAFHNGYTLATHFYSAMLGVTRRNTYRYAGVVEAGYLIDDMDVEIIADGSHLPAPLLKLIYKIKGPKRTALITDSMRAAAMPEGNSLLGGYKNGVEVLVEEGVAKMPDRSSFAGSVSTFDRLVRTMLNMAEVPMLETIEMASLTPARIMKVDAQKGSLEVGKDADILIFDEEINIKMTMVEGRVVYSL